MVAVRRLSTTWSLPCVRRGVPDRLTLRPRRKWICPVRNHGGRKELVAPAPVTNRRPSGAAVASFLGQSPAIIPKRFQKALSERIKAGDVLAIDKFAVSEIKTKAFVDLVREQTDAEKVLIVSDSFDDRTYKSARNVKPVKLASAADVNTEQLLAFQKILVTSKALEKLAERFNPPTQEEPSAE